MRLSPALLRASSGVAACWLVALCGCTGGEDTAYRSVSPARGPGGMVGNGAPITQGVFEGGEDAAPVAREVGMPDGQRLPDCDTTCRAYCDSLTLDNPINRGMCESTWGVGLELRPVLGHEACRRLFADTQGYLPTRAEVSETCEGRTWGDVVDDLMGREAFAEVQQRRWADKLRYDTESVSVERIFDMDRLVGKLYEGRLSYDLFASVVSAHPVLTRRHDTPGDRAEALFTLFLHRPPLGNERSDIARLYNLWSNGYYDHPQLGIRLPDSYIRYRCVDDQGEREAQAAGECTSILYGYNELILEPDFRASETERDGLQMWSGLLRDDEWGQLGMPGRLLAKQRTFWEAAVDEVLETYLDYKLGRLIPQVRDELVSHVLAHDGDIRALHHAVLTSQVYLQSAMGQTPREYRWTWGPLKQVEAEVWIDTLARATSYRAMPTSCDWRINRPEAFLETGRVSGYALVENSRWEINDDGEVRGKYRKLARTLGGCPSNDVGGRFKVTSILTTSTQLGFVNEVCDPSMTGEGAPIEALLPPTIGPQKAVTPALAAEIVSHQTGLFYGRAPTPGELEDAKRFGAQCERQVCTAQEFARPACFAMLSSSEMLFY